MASPSCAISSFPDFHISLERHHSVHRLSTLLLSQHTNHIHHESNPCHMSLITDVQPNLFRDITHNLCKTHIRSVAVVTWQFLYEVLVPKVDRIFTNYKDWNVYMKLQLLMGLPLLIDLSENFSILSTSFLCPNTTHTLGCKKNYYLIKRTTLTF
jgi:hypothetical protein